MNFQVRDKVISFIGLKLKILTTNELRPSETVGAIRMTGLPWRRKKQYCFWVFMLQPS